MQAPTGVDGPQSYRILALDLSPGQGKRHLGQLQVLEGGCRIGGGRTRNVVLTMARTWPWCPHVDRLEQPLCRTLIYRGWWLVGAALATYAPERMPADLFDLEPPTWAQCRSDLDRSLLPDRSLSRHSVGRMARLPSLRSFAVGPECALPFVTRFGIHLETSSWAMPVGGMCYRGYLC
jgi:hypothetical protein